ncbi:MAG: hypothetical protein ACXVAX_13300, partial [Pseudobdellovibrio sp.]
EGVHFANVNKNIDLLTPAASKQFEFFLDITLTSLNLFFIRDFADYALKKNIKVLAKLMNGGEENFPLLRTEAIPAAIKNEVLKRWNSYYVQLAPEQKELLENLNSTLQFFSTKPVDTGIVLAESLRKLKLFESMYPEKDKFIQLLKNDSIGNRWAESFG